MSIFERKSALFLLCKTHLWCYVSISISKSCWSLLPGLTRKWISYVRFFLLSTLVYVYMKVNMFLLLLFHC